MSNVTLTIGGRQFTVACADGEERHVIQLGQVIAERVIQIGAASQSETRMLLYAALMLADELHEAQSSAAGHADKADDPAFGDRVALVAERLEALAERLEERAASA